VQKKEQQTQQDTSIFIQMHKYETKNSHAVEQQLKELVLLLRWMLKDGDIIKELLPQYR